MFNIENYIEPLLVNKTLSSKLNFVVTPNSTESLLAEGIFNLTREMATALDKEVRNNFIDTADEEGLDYIESNFMSSKNVDNTIPFSNGEVILRTKDGSLLKYSLANNILPGTLSTQSYYYIYLDKEIDKNLYNNSEVAIEGKVIGTEIFNTLQSGFDSLTLATGTTLEIDQGFLQNNKLPDNLELYVRTTLRTLNFNIGVNNKRERLRKLKENMFASSRNRLEGELYKITDLDRYVIDYKDNDVFIYVLTNVNKNTQSKNSYTMKEIQAVVESVLNHGVSYSYREPEPLAIDLVVKYSTVTPSVLQRVKDMFKTYYDYRDNKLMFSELKIEIEKNIDKNMILQSMRVYDPSISEYIEIDNTTFIEYPYDYFYYLRDIINV